MKLKGGHKRERERERERESLCRRGLLHDSPLQMHAVIFYIPSTLADFMSVEIVPRKEVFRAVWSSVIVARSEVNSSSIFKRSSYQPSKNKDLLTPMTCHAHCTVPLANTHTRHQTLAFEDKRNCCSVQRALTAASKSIAWWKVPMLPPFVDMYMSYRWRESFNTLRTGSFKLFKRPFPGFLTILTL